MGVKEVLWLLTIHSIIIILNSSYPNSWNNRAYLNSKSTKLLKFDRHWEAWQLNQQGESEDPWMLELRIQVYLRPSSSEDQTRIAIPSKRNPVCSILGEHTFGPLLETLTWNSPWWRARSWPSCWSYRHSLPLPWREGVLRTTQQVLQISHGQCLTHSVENIKVGAWSNGQRPGRLC